MLKLQNLQLFKFRRENLRCPTKTVKRHVVFFKVLLEHTWKNCWGLCLSQSGVLLMIFADFLSSLSLYISIYYFFFPKATHFLKNCSIRVIVYAGQAENNKPCVYLPAKQLTRLMPQLTGSFLFNSLLVHELQFHAWVKLQITTCHGPSWSLAQGWHHEH